MGGEEEIGFVEKIGRVLLVEDEEKDKEEGGKSSSNSSSTPDYNLL